MDTFKICRSNNKGERKKNLQFYDPSLVHKEGAGGNLTNFLDFLYMLSSDFPIYFSSLKAKIKETKAKNTQSVRVAGVNLNIFKLSAHG